VLDPIGGLDQIKKTAQPTLLPCVFRAGSHWRVGSDKPNRSATRFFRLSVPAGSTKQGQSKPANPPLPMGGVSGCGRTGGWHSLTLTRIRSHPTASWPHCSCRKSFHIPSLGAHLAIMPVPALGAKDLIRWPPLICSDTKHHIISSLLWLRHLIPHHHITTSLHPFIPSGSLALWLSDT
jgi:hypothetical protein